MSTHLNSWNQRHNKSGYKIYNILTNSIAKKKLRNAKILYLTVFQNDYCNYGALTPNTYWLLAGATEATYGLQTASKLRRPMVNSSLITILTSPTRSGRTGTPLRTCSSPVPVRPRPFPHSPSTSARHVRSPRPRPLPSARPPPLPRPFPHSSLTSCRSSSIARLFSVCLHPTLGTRSPVVPLPFPCSPAVPRSFPGRSSPVLRPFPCRSPAVPLPFPVRSLRLCPSPRIHVSPPVPHPLPPSSCPSPRSSLSCPCPFPSVPILCLPVLSYCAETQK